MMRAVPGSRAWYAAIQRESELRWQAMERREQWEEENERIRGRYRTPRSDRPRCGARCRSGKPCQAPAVWDYGHNRPRNGRCRMHGGLSTGAKTEEGRRRSREGAKRGALVSADRRRERRAGQEQGPV
jgi:hypothetical protein